MTARFWSRVVVHVRQQVIAVFRAIAAVFSHSDLPGYRVLSWRDRARVNAKAGGRLLRSAAALHMLAALAVWLLFGYLLVWSADWPSPAVHMPFPAALLWLLPWLAAARRRELRALLGTSWTFVYRI